MFISEAVAATAAPAAGAARVFPPFDTATFAGQLFWLAIIFGGLYYVMSRVALPRVAAILENRQSRIAGDLEAASAAQKSADEAGAASEKTLADAKANAQK
ncbi:MAG TPA: F0F1 ATP synthase subunit B', partial [Beijerinckiaceae bacterium]